jgi:hypothetical protein
VSQPVSTVRRVDLTIDVSARRHGVADEDVRHAWRNHILSHEADDEGVVILVGPARDGSLLEVGMISSDTSIRIIHCMPARPRYLR